MGECRWNADSQHLLISLTYKGSSEVLIESFLYLSICPSLEKRKKIFLCQDKLLCTIYWMSSKTFKNIHSQMYNFFFFFGLKGSILLVVSEPCFYRMFCSLFSHSPTDGYLGSCSTIGGIIGQVKMCVAGASVGQLPTCDIDGLEGICVLTYDTCFQIALQKSRSSSPDTSCKRPVSSHPPNRR